MHRFKSSIKKLAGAAAERLIEWYDTNKEMRVILMYHRVVRGSIPYMCDEALFVTDKTLEMHIQTIRKKFEIVPLDAIGQIHKRYRGRRCAITFDDGWADNYDVALPILRKYDTPATIFLSVNMIDGKGRYWFHGLWDIASRLKGPQEAQAFERYFLKAVPGWQNRGVGRSSLCDLQAAMKGMDASELESTISGAYKIIGIEKNGQEDLLSWDQIREMGNHNITFGSHGMNHYILTQASAEEKRDEIVGSMQELRNKGIAITPYYSYPNGNWDDAALNIVKEAGYDGAVTTQVGIVRNGDDPHLMRRIAMHDEISSTPELLWYRLFQGIAA